MYLRRLATSLLENGGKVQPRGALMTGTCENRPTVAEFVVGTT